MTKRFASFGTLALAVALLFASAAQAITCPPDAVPVGTVCVDKYEASVWSVPTENATLVNKIKDGTVTLGELLAGATPLGCGSEHDPFPVNFPPNGNWTPIVGSPTPGIYAASVAGVQPSNCITWFQAQQACLLSDKRMITNAEWQAAAAGTPDPGNADDGSTTCATTTGPNAPDPAATGSRESCKSNWEAFDMVGNVWEWVDHWVPYSSETCPGWGGFSDDRMCLSGVKATSTGPGALTRGGGWYNGGAFPHGLQAGVFAVDGNEQPSQPGNAGQGFRCAR